ncbi:MAG: hydantoinase B/oxoprolinase family protein, partial [Solirubrobacteraceae bacterium]
LLLNTRVPRLVKRRLAAMEELARQLARGAALGEREVDGASVADAIARLQTGWHHAEATIMHPALSVQPRVRVGLQAGSGRLVVDLTACDGVVEAPVNSVRSHAEDCCVRALAEALGLDLASLRVAVEVRTRPGTIVDASPPAQFGLSRELAQRAIRRGATKALQAAGAAPDRDPDGWWSQIGRGALARRVDVDTLRPASGLVASVIAEEERLEHAAA